ncbi:MAG: PQQ-binding-like beta-propeller repeat protein [Bdellovibrionales bacterium]|nr:PQQ-binding-like beta-propeller repeat protein [Bdellovibrionales bacterium]
MSELDLMHVSPMIIPTVLIPFTLVSVALTVVASFIAGLFGIKLKTEGPKRLLELLLKPKILIIAAVSNVFIYAGIKGYRYLSDYPSFIWTIEKANKDIENKTWTMGELEKNRAISILTEPVATKNQNIVDVEVIWKKSIDGGVFAKPSRKGDSIFVSSMDKNIHQMNLSSGKLERKFRIGAMGTSSPAFWKNYFFVGEGVHDTHHARVYKYDLISSQLVNYYQTTGHTEGSVRVGSYQGIDLVFAVAGEDGIHAINPETMQTVWQDHPGHMDAGVVIEDGVVYVGTGRTKDDSKKHKSFALAYDFLTGKQLWKRELPNSSWMPPAVTKKYACYILGEVYFKNEFGGVYCFDKKSGDSKFILSSTESFIGSPEKVGDSYYFTSVEGTICKADFENKEFSWCTKTEVPKRAYSPASYDHFRDVVLYPGTTSGLYVLSPVTGEIIYHWKPKDWEPNYAGVLVTEKGWILSSMKGTVELVIPKVQTLRTSL